MGPTGGRVVSSILTLSCAVSCGDSPTAPTGRASGASATAAQTVRLELEGPRSLAPGATTQLRLIAHRPDGEAEDVTSRAQFVSASPETLRASAGGLATGLAPGDGLVTAWFESRQAYIEIVVVPDGTYRVVGRVLLASAPAVAIVGARVESAGVPPSVTDLMGQFRLYGVRGDGRLRVSKNLYVTKEVALAISDHHVEDVLLAASDPHFDVAGVYQMTVDASGACRDRIPEELLTRRYRATITQQGPEIQVALSGPRFFPAFRGPSDTTLIPGWVEQGQMFLDLAWPTHCEGTEPDARIVEIIDGGTYLEISGSGALSRSGNGFAGTLRGVVVVQASPYCGSAAVQSFCQGASYRVTLSR